MARVIISPESLITYPALDSSLNTTHSFPLLLPAPPVYDVTKFMDEHPGGDEVLTAEAGKDASEAFEDVGHSDDARSLLPAMLVGAMEGAVSCTVVHCRRSHLLTNRLESLLQVAKAKPAASALNQSEQKNGK